MSILLTCACGKKLRVAADQIGQRVKCPGCKKVLIVPGPVEEAEAEDAPAPVKGPSDDDLPDDEADGDEDGMSKAPPGDDEASDDEPAPRKKAAAKPAPAKRSAGKLIAVGCVVLVVLASCFGGVGVGVWFFFFRGGSAENAIVGSWVVDIEASKTASPSKWHAAPPYAAWEFKKDGTYQSVVDHRTDSFLQSGNWKVTSTEKGALKITMSPTSGAKVGQMLRLTPKGADLLMAENEIKAEFVLKRANTFPKAAKTTDDGFYTIKPRAEFEAGAGKSGDDKKVDQLFLSRDGRRAAVGTYARLGGPKPKLQVWDLADPPKKVQDIDGSALALSPDGKTVIRMKDFTPSLVEAEGGKEIASVNDLGQYRFVGNDAFWVLPGGYDLDKPKKLVVRLCDAATGKKTGDLELGSDDRVCFAPPSGDDQELIFAAKSNQVAVWDRAAKKTTLQVGVKLGLGEEIEIGTGYRCLAVSTDKKWLVTLAGPANKRDGVIVDLGTGAVTKLPAKIYLDHAVFVPNRPLVLIRGYADEKKGQVSVIDVTKGVVVAAFGPVEAPIEAIAVSADGTTVAAGTKDGKVALWDVKGLK